MSMGLLVDQGEAVVWRGPMLHGAVKSFLHDVDWGDLDYLLVDLPPGTGDVQLSLIQQTFVAGAVVVTTPSTVAIEDAVKAISMFGKLQVPVLGVIENMSYFVCPQCSTRHEIFNSGSPESRAAALALPFLGAIPMHPDVRAGGDHGRPVVLDKPDSDYARALSAIAGRLAQRISIHSSASRCPRDARDLRGPRRDHAARPDVIEAMRPFLDPAGFGNASSVHAAREAARAAIEDARARVAELIGRQPRGDRLHGQRVGGQQPGAVRPARRRDGFAPASRRVGDRASVGARDARARARTSRHAGDDRPGRTERARRPRSPRGRSGRRRGAGLGDVGQQRGPERSSRSSGSPRSPTPRERGSTATPSRRWASFRSTSPRPDVDLLSLAAHKLHGPLGAAALFVRRRTRLVPLVHGGHQERSRRAGTENLPAIVGFGAAAVHAARWLEGDGPARLEARGEALRAGLEAAVPDTRLNGDRDRRLRSIVNLCFAGVDGEAVLHELDRAGITVSTGSACSAATPGPSHVLIAMGLRPEDAHASVRFSLGESTSGRGRAADRRGRAAR